MKALFTIHAGEYIAGSHIEATYKQWSLWLPAKDTGIDLLVTNPKTKRMVSLQVKSSKDFTPTGTPVQQNNLLAIGWWTHDPKGIAKSVADFWVFVLPSFFEKEISYVIAPPAELLRRFQAIPEVCKGKNIQSYFDITKKRRCFQARGLSKTERDAIAVGEYENKSRDFTKYLNAWKQIEDRLNC
jgi:hypothetical protein